MRQRLDLVLRVVDGELGVVALVVDELGDAEGRAERSPVAVVLVDGDGHPLAVLRLVRRGVRRAGLARTRVLVAVHVQSGEDRGEPHAGAIERRGHVIPLARLLTAVERRADGAGQHGAARDVAESVGGAHGIGLLRVDHHALGEAGLGEQRHEVEPGRVLERSLVAVAGEGRADQLGIAVLEAFVVEPHLGKRLVAVVRQKDVGMRQKLVEPLQALGIAQIEAHELLAAVDGVEQHVLLVGARHAERRGEVALHVAFRRLDLDDARALRGQHAPARRHGEVAAQLDDRDALQRFHTFSSL